MENTYIVNLNDELYHYGVIGMKWGVRRARKALGKSASDADANRAFSKLQKHRAKGTAEVAKLQKRRDKLETQLVKSSKKDAEKASKLERKAAKLDNKAAKNMKKAAGRFTSAEKALELKAKSDSLKLKSDLLKTKAASLHTKYELAKQKVDSNERMQNAFQTQIDKIDTTFAEYGRHYLDSFDS